MTSSHQVHGHAVIDLVADHPQGVEREIIFKIVTQEHGESVRFKTCSAENMDFPQLLAFLEEKNKIQIRGTLLFPGNSPACEHDHA